MARKTVKHYFLRIGPRALSRTEAKNRICKVLDVFSKPKLDLDRMLRVNSNPSLTFTDGHGQTKKIQYQDLVTETSRTGVIPELERILWSNSHPDGSIAVATDANQLPKVVLTTASRSFTTSEMEAPGSVTNDVMVPLLEDVLFYRREAVRFSFFDDSQYERAFRAYRSYLVACISAVDAFLNERAWITLKDPKRKPRLTSAERKVLENRRVSILVKLGKWPQILFGCSKLRKKMPELIDFHKIRSERNAVVHVNAPEFNFSLRKAAGILNLCRLGVGGLLAYLEVAGKRYPAPKVTAVRLARAVSFRPKPSTPATTRL
jgi:hypothetical protein